MTVRRPIQWPDREIAAVYFGYGLLVAAVFIMVYGGANWLAAGSGSDYRLYMDWELSIPFMPGFVWIYCSLWVVLFMTLFQLDPAGLRRLAIQVIVTMLASGVVFVLLPADVGFGRSANLTIRSK